MNISEIVNVCENNEYYTCVIVFRTMDAKKEVYNKLMKWKEKFQSTIMSNIMNKYEISFINGSRIILILSNYNTRGMKCDKLFYEDGI